MVTRRIRPAAVLLTAVMLLSSTAFPAAAAVKMENFQKSRGYSGQFSDLVKTAWYYGEVVSSYEYGLANGSNGKFLPDGNVTVAEAVTFAARIRCVYQGDDPAALVKSGGAWYAGYVEYAEKTGMIAANEFAGKYQEKASRAVLGHILAHALPESEFPVINDAFSKIPDMDEGNPSYADVLLLFRAGIVTGSDAYANFKPDTNITRAEAAAILNRIAVASGRKRFSPLVGSVALSENTLALHPGDTAQLAAFPALNADNGGWIVWMSSDDKIATVSESGTVTALAAGTADIYTTESDGTKNSPLCTVTVSNGNVLSQADLYTAASAAVFSMQTFDENGKQIGTGTGFFASADGIAYTTYQAVDGIASVILQTSQGTTHANVGIIGFDRLHNIAVLKVSSKMAFSYLPLGDSGSLKEGDAVYAAVNPAGSAVKMTEGRVASLSSHFANSYRDAEYIETTASLAKGASGGATLNAYGEIVGMATTGQDAGSEVNFAVPVNALKEVRTFAVKSFTELDKQLYQGVADYEKQIAYANGENKDYTTAQPLKNGDTVLGTLKDKTVKDYYTFQTDKAGVLKVTLQQHPVFARSTSVYLLDASFKAIDSTVYTDDACDYRCFYLKPGTYTFSIALHEDSKLENVPYSTYFRFSAE